MMRNGKFEGQKLAKAFANVTIDDNLGAGVQGGFPILNYRGKRWSLRYQGKMYPFVRDDDGSPQTYLDVIILNANKHISKTYFPPGEWDEDSASGPICSSLAGDKPDPGVEQPQSTSCASCKNNVWTTQPNGRKGRACQDHKRLALLFMPEMTRKMLGSPLKAPVYLKVPPGSLGSLKLYNDELAHEGYPYYSVITRLAFNPDKLFEITFEGVRALKEGEAELIVQLREDPATARILGSQPAIREINPAPERKKIAPAPVEEVGDEEFFDSKKGGGEAVAEERDDPPIVPLPVKKRGRPAKAPTTPDEEPPEAAELPKMAAPMDEEEEKFDADFQRLLDLRVEGMMPPKK